MFCAGVEEAPNGTKNNACDDSDSLGNSNPSKISITPPNKERRKPFFKKVICYLRSCVCLTCSVSSNIGSSQS